MPRYHSRDLRLMSQEERERMQARRKVCGAIRAYRAENLSKVRLKEAITKAKISVDFYNSDHQGNEIELVEFLVLRHASLGDPFVHINFTAKPKNADCFDTPILFFAELRLSPSKYEPTKCVMLGEDVVYRCRFCFERFKIAHPPS